jgi:hypothetical protein
MASRSALIFTLPATELAQGSYGESSFLALEGGDVVGEGIRLYMQQHHQALTEIDFEAGRSGEGIQEELQASDGPVSALVMMRVSSMYYKTGHDTSDVRRCSNTSPDLCVSHVAVHQRRPRTSMGRGGLLGAGPICTGTREHYTH